MRFNFVSGKIAEPAPAPLRVYSFWEKCLILFLCVMFICVGIGGIVYFFKKIAPYYCSSDWVQTACVIERASITEKRSSKRAHYSPDVAYVYEWHGQKKSGTIFSFGDNSSANREDIKTEIAPYVAGKGALCFVNPASPAESVLERKLNPVNWLTFVFLSFFGIVGMALFYAAIPLLLFNSVEKMKRFSDAHRRFWPRLWFRAFFVGGTLAIMTGAYFLGGFDAPGAVSFFGVPVFGIFAKLLPLLLLVPLTFWEIHEIRLAIKLTREHFAGKR